MYIGLPSNRKTISKLGNNRKEKGPRGRFQTGKLETADGDPDTHLMHNACWTLPLRYNLSRGTSPSLGSSIRGCYRRRYLGKHWDIGVAEGSCGDSFSSM